MTPDRLAVMTPSKDESIDTAADSARRERVCHEEVSRAGQAEPCEMLAVAMRLDAANGGGPYPVCSTHVRQPMLSLSALVDRDTATLREERDAALARADNLSRQHDFDQIERERDAALTQRDRAHVTIRTFVSGTETLTAERDTLAKAGETLGKIITGLQSDMLAALGLDEDDHDGVDWMNVAMRVRRLGSDLRQAEAQARLFKGDAVSALAHAETAEKAGMWQVQGTTPDPDPAVDEQDWSPSPDDAMYSSNAALSGERLPCDQCGKTSTHTSTPGGFRGCDDHFKPRGQQ